MLAADGDGNASTLAKYYDVKFAWDNPNDSPDAGKQVYDTMFPINEMTYHARGGKEEHLASRQKVANQGRADARLAVDGNGELYIYSKSDGMIRQVVGGGVQVSDAPHALGHRARRVGGCRGRAADCAATLTLELKDFATLPITGKLDGAGQVDGMLARVNSIREEPGGAGRLFVTDMNGPIYILDKKTKALTTYLDFNGRGDRAGHLRQAAITIRDTAAASASSSSIRITGATASSTPCTWKARRCRARSGRTRRTCRA